MQYNTLGYTSLMAEEWGRRDVVELLLNYGADINSTNEDGNSIYFHVMKIQFKFICFYFCQSLCSYN